jgi:hypothetical protein
MFSAGIAIFGVAGLAACAPTAPYEPAVQERAAPSLPEAGSVTTQTLDGDAGDGTSGEGDGSDTVTQPGPGGLTERLPDTCQLDDYRQYVGREGVTAAPRVIDRPVRVIAPDAIVSQVYNPQRVNFYTDAEGRVTRISCG